MSQAKKSEGSIGVFFSVIALLFVGVVFGRIWGSNTGQRLDSRTPDIVLSWGVLSKPQQTSKDSVWTANFTAQSGSQKLVCLPNRAIADTAAQFANTGKMVVIVLEQITGTGESRCTDQRVIGITEVPK